MSGLTREQIKHFEEEGYVVVEGVLNSKEVLDPVIKEYSFVLDCLANELYKNGEISSRYDDLDFGDRMIEIIKESGKLHNQYFDMSLPSFNVTEDTPFWTGQAVFDVLTAESLLDAVESLIGPEIYSNPVQHVRIKPPEKCEPKDKYGNPTVGATAWHQDHGVVTVDADETKMLTVWLSLQDAPVEKGPLKVVPRSHKNGLLAHCPNYLGNGRESAGKIQIPEKLFEVEDMTPLPMKSGDVIFMHKQTVHGSLSNVSDEIRWSFDLRYNPVGQPTGRAAFPGFVVRSHINPASVLHDAEEWTKLWMEARKKMCGINQGAEKELKFRRWTEGQLDCA